MILASLSFSLMVACVKLVRAELDPLQVVFWRAAISTPLLLIPVVRGPGFRIGRRKAFVSRLLFGFIAMSCFYTAAKGLALVDLSLISRLQPILLAVLAPLVLGRDERAQPGVWVAAAIGFSGCALILGPELAVGSLWGAWALAATFSSACAHLSLRRVAAADAGMTIVFWFHLGMLVLAALGLGLDGELPRLPSGVLLWPLLARRGRRFLQCDPVLAAAGPRRVSATADSGRSRRRSSRRRLQPLARGQGRPRQTAPREPSLISFEPRTCRYYSVSNSGGAPPSGTKISAAEFMQ
jgi:hypothetical protein